MSNRLNIYQTPPQAEHRALDDCRRARIKAALPRSTIRSRARPLINGYVYADGKPLDTPYMHGKPLGSVARTEIARLWTHCRVRHPSRPENPYKAGDHVVIAKGAFAEVRATVAEVRARCCIVAFDLLGKTHQQALSYVQLRPG